MTTEHIKELQTAVDGTVAHHGLPWLKIKIDGDMGAATWDCVHTAAWVMGFSPDAMKSIKNRHLTPWDFAVLTHHKERTDAMKHRAIEREPAIKKLIEEHNHPEKMFNAGGWAPPGPFSMQRQDQGQDFEISLDHHIVAPGRATVISHASDGPFPSGFGSPYAIVEVHDGRFAIGNGQWYVGHCNVDVAPVGTKLSFGDPIARANNSMNAGWGWCELGKWDGGPHPDGEGAIYAHLFTPIRHAVG